MILIVSSVSTRNVLSPVLLPLAFTVFEILFNAIYWTGCYDTYCNLQSYCTVQGRGRPSPVCGMGSVGRSSHGVVRAALGVLFVCLFLFLFGHVSGRRMCRTAEGDELLRPARQRWVNGYRMRIYVYSKYGTKTKPNVSLLLSDFPTSVDVGSLISLEDEGITGMATTAVAILSPSPSSVVHVLKVQPRPQLRFHHFLPVSGFLTLLVLPNLFSSPSQFRRFGR